MTELTMTAPDRISAILGDLDDRDLFPAWALARVYAREGWMDEEEASAWERGIFEEVELRELKIKDVAPIVDP